MPSVLISDFSGGAVDPRSLYPGAGQALALEGADHRGPGLRPFKGPLVVSEYGSSLSNADVTDILNVEEYVSTAGKPYWIAKRGRYVWLGLLDAGWDLYRGSVPTWCLMLDESSDDIVDRFGYFTTSIKNTGTSPYRLWSGNVRRFREGYYITVGEQPALPVGVHAFVLWAKLEGSVDGKHFLLSSRDTAGAALPGVELWVEDGKVGYIVCEDATANKYSQALTQEAVIEPDTWHCIVAYRNGTAYPAIYIDGAGVAVDTSGAMGSWAIGTNDLALGERVGKSAGDGNTWNGLMSAVRYTTSPEVAATYAQEASRYAETPQALQVKWVPLLGAAWAHTLYYTEPRLRTDSPEQVVQVGSYAYLTPDEPGANDLVQRWDGFVFEDPYHCNGDASANVTLRGYVPENIGIRSGDQIYFKVWDGAQMVWDVKNGRAIRSVDTVNHKLVLWTAYDTTGLGDGGAGDDVGCCIVRLHRLGLMPGTTTTLAKGAAGNPPAAGTYRATWRVINSKTGYAGTIATPSAAYTQPDPPTNKITVSGWPAGGDTFDIDGIEIYVSVDGGTYKLWHTITRLATAERLFATSYDLASTDTIGDDLEADAAYHTRPGPMTNLINYGGRLHGRAIDEPHYWQFSTLDKFEYWPTSASVDPSLEATLGGRLMVGGGLSEPVIGAINESGAYQQTGLPGSNLLLYLPTRAVRLFGFDRSDFSPEHAFYDGLINPRAVAGAYGRTVWINQHGHVCALAVGSSEPARIHRVRQRDGITLTEANRRSLRVSAYDGWYIVPELGMCDADNLTWTDIAEDSAYKLKWGVCQTATRHPSSYPFIACGPDKNGTGRIWALFEDASTPVTLTWKGALPPIAADDAVMWRMLKFLTICCVPYAAAGSPQSTPSVTVEILADHNTSIEEIGPIVLPVPTASSEYQRIRQRIKLSESAVDGALQLTLVVPPRFHLDWLKLDYDLISPEGSL